MILRSALGPALPPALDAHLRRAVEEGAAPIPLVKLNTAVPGLQPKVMDFGGAYTLTVYPGPLMHFSVAPKLGRHLDATA